MCVCVYVCVCVCITLNNLSTSSLIVGSMSTVAEPTQILRQFSCAIHKAQPL